MPLRTCAAALTLVGFAITSRFYAPRLDAQAPLSVEAFEVASIKVRTGEIAFGGPSSPDRFTRPDTTLHNLIRYAYNLQDFQIDGGPGWLTSSRFEVSAKAASRPATADHMRAMVKRLLLERFNLKAHTETRELPIYALVLARRDGKLGEKLRPSAIDCEAILAARGPAPAPAKGEIPQCATRFRTMLGGRNGAQPPGIVSMTMMLEGTSMSRFAVLLQNESRRVVKDKTALTGTFDLELEFAPQAVLAGLPVGASPASSDRPSLFTALQEQLGLKLESERGPVDVLTIDSAEPPAPD